MEQDTVLEFKFGPMEQNMKVNGGIIKQTVKENFGMQMETFMRVSGKMIKQMDMVFIYIVMVPDMMDSGKMIYRMVKELKFGKYKF